MGRRSDHGDDLVALPVAARSALSGPDVPTRRPGLVPVLGVGVLLAALVAGGALTGVDGPARHTATEAAAARPPAPAPPRADEPAPAGWRRGSPGPLRHRDGAVEAWTGRALVVWGGDPDGDTGAAYDPVADRWRPLERAPIPARCGGTAAWTGRALLVWGPACSAGGPAAAAAWTPAGPGRPGEPGAPGRWRTLPPGPLPGGADPVSAWTGRDWLVVTPSGRAAALDPDRGRWRALAPAPRPFTTATAAWTGRELAVVAWEANGRGPAAAGPVYRHWAAALDPAAGRWRTLPDPPLALAATAVWDGRRLVAWDQNLRSAALDPAAPGPAWRRLPDLPVGFTDCRPQGGLVAGMVFAEECGRAAVLHSGTDTWERVPHPRSLAEAPIWTGRDAVFWMGRFPGSTDGVWLYRPSPARAAGSPGAGR